MPLLIDGRYRVDVEANGEELHTEADDLLLGGRRSVHLLPPELATGSLEHPALQGRIRHPYLMEVYGSGRVREIGPLHRYAYVISERVEGQTLAELLAGSPCSPGLGTRVGAGALAALEALHELGLYHGDLRPERILVLPGGVKLTGVGLSKLAPSPSVHCAPEIRAGQRPDPRADLYALGSCLYQAVTGRLPDPDRPLPITDLRPDVPSSLARAVATLLEREPRARDARAVKALLAGEGEAQRTALAAHVEPAFVGRQHALETLPAALEEARALAVAGRAAREGIRPGETPPLVVVSAPEGLGKTRLLSEAATRLAQGGARVLWGQGFAGGGPYSGWRTVIDRACRIGDHVELADRAQEALSSFNTREPEARHEHVARLLLALATTRPTCLVIDDAHLLDPPSVDLLVHVARAAAAPSAGGALAIFLGVRPGTGDPLRAALDAPLAPAHRELPLTELDEAEARALVASILLSPSKSEDVDRLAQLGGGNPFLLVELAREWRRGGDTPASVQDAISARLAKASPPARAVLEGLAVLGRPASLDLLSALTPSGNALTHLDELVALGILTPGPDDGCAFRHQVTRRILVEELSDDALTERAAAALAALEREPGATLGERARLALLANSEGAAQLALEAAADDPDPQPLYEGAIELLPASPERVDAHLRLAAHLLGRGSFAEAHRVLEGASLDLADDAPPAQRAALHLARAEIASAEGDTAPALSWAGQGLAALDEAPGAAPATRARLCSVEAKTHTLRGDHAGAAQRYARAREAAQAAEDEALSLRLQIEEAQSLVLSLDRTRYDAAKQQIEAALETHKERGDEAGQQHAWHVLGNHAFYAGDMGGAGVCFHKALDFSERLADLSKASGMLNNLGFVAKERGQLRAAEGYLERALDIAERIGQPSVLCRAMTNVGRVRRELGDLRGAQRSFRRAAKIAHDCGDAMIESAARSELGNARLAEGRIEAALHALRRSRSLRLRLGDVGRVAASELELGELWRTTGDVRAALRCTARALALQAALGDGEGTAIAVEALEFAVGRPGGPAALLSHLRRRPRTSRLPASVREGLERGRPVAQLALRLLAAALTGRAGDAEQAAAHAGHAARAQADLDPDLAEPILALARALELESRAVVSAANGKLQDALGHVDAALDEVDGVRRGALLLKRAFLLLALRNPDEAANTLAEADGQRVTLPEPLAERRRVGMSLISSSIRRRGKGAVPIDTNSAIVRRGGVVPVDTISLHKAREVSRRLGDVSLLALVAAARAEEAVTASPYEATLERADARIAAARLVTGLPASLRDSLRRAAAPVPEEESLTLALAPDQNLLLSMVSRVLGTGLEVEPLLGASMDALLQGTGAERGLVALRDAKGEIEFRAARKLDPQDLAKATREVIEHVAREGISVRLDNATDGRFGRARKNPRSVLAMPIVAGDDILGVVYLDHPERSSRFGETDAALVGAFASRIAGPIQGSLAREEKIGELSRIADAYRETARELSGTDPDDPLVGNSPGMRGLKRLIVRYGNTHAPVTIFGESGTGKELVAQAVHLASKRSQRPFIVINCAAMPDNLLESELFGVLKGAYTGADRDRKGLFELAHEGTLFLDEVGDMSLDMQAKLLRVLESGELRRVGGRKVIQVDVRIISATHHDLRELVALQQFREDLFYRLNVLRLELPPLRERREDIPMLCAHFLKLTAKQNQTPVKQLAPEALQVLLQHPFPGNVRELLNVIQRAYALEPGDVITPPRLALDQSTALAPAPAHGSPDYHKTFEFQGVALNRRQRTVLDHLRTGIPAITNREYCSLVGVSERTGLRDLTHLVKSGILHRVGKRKGARYQLVEAGG